MRKEREIRHVAPDKIRAGDWARFREDASFALITGVEKLRNPTSQIEIRYRLSIPHSADPEAYYDIDIPRQKRSYRKLFYAIYRPGAEVPVEWLRAFLPQTDFGS